MIPANDDDLRIITYYFVLNSGLKRVLAAIYSLPLDMENGDGLSTGTLPYLVTLPVPSTRRRYSLSGAVPTVSRRTRDCGTEEGPGDGMPHLLPHPQSGKQTFVDPFDLGEFRRLGEAEEA